MMELKRYPAQVLRKRCKPVREIDDEVAERAREMLDFMYASAGLGLAAAQIGWSRRVVTLDPALRHEGQRVFVNPIIIAREGHLEHEEGCLSLPGVQVNVPRAEKVALVAYTLGGERVEIEAEELAACAWQHELDHLNGVLIIDKIPPAGRLALRDQLRRLEQEAAGAER